MDLVVCLFDYLNHYYLNHIEQTTDFLFGISSGIMLSASFFSLLSPAIKHSEDVGVAPLLPLAVGFAAGIAFIKLLEFIVPTRRCCLPLTSPRTIRHMPVVNEEEIELDEISIEDATQEVVLNEQSNIIDTCFGRIPMNVFLLFIAVTVHNIPEGLVIGFGYGAANQKAYKLSDALLLTVAISLQNIPEGMALSVPLQKAGMSKMKSFVVAQFSGLIEVFAALIGVSFVVSVKSLLSYALSFASGAMIYVVFAELLPLSNKSHKKWGIWGSIIGFTIMMILDVGFGH